MIKINFVKNRVKPIRTTPERLHPLLLSMLLVVYAVVLGLAIVGYHSYETSRNIVQNRLSQLKQQVQKAKKKPVKLTEEDRTLAKQARRLRTILTNQTNTFPILQAVADSIPKQAAIESLQMQAGKKIKITGVVAARTDARGKVWTFVRNLRKNSDFSEQVAEINLEKASSIESPTGMRFVIMAPLADKSLRSLIRTAH